MPQVPVYGDLQVNPQGIPNVHMGADASLDSFGGGNSLAQAGEATQRAEQTTTDIMSEEKQKADQLAHLSMDSKLSDAQTQIQINASKMLGKDALGAPDYAKSQWDKTTQEIAGQATNDAQKLAITRSATQRWDELNKFTQQHVSTQIEQFDDNETSGYLASSRSAAVLNAGDDEKVGMELARQKAVLTDYAKRKGILDSDQLNQKIADQLSGTNREVIQARLDKDSPDNVNQAKEYFAAHKSELNGQDLIAAQKAIDGAETMSIGLKAWDDVKGMQLSDGKPDEGKMQAAIYGRDDLSDERKEQVWQFVKARARESMVQKNMEDQSNDRDFMNDVIKARKQGQPMSDALKLVSDYAKDDYDSSIKQNAIRQIYAPPTESDPHAFMNLWEKTQGQTVSKVDIDNAFQKGQISVGDWKNLREQYYKVNVEGTDPNSKFTDENVKEQAAQKFSGDKDKLAQFMYVYHTQTQDMTPEQKAKIAKDLMSNAPDSGWFSSKQNFQTEYQRLNAQNLAWGTVHSDVGVDETKAIGQGVLNSGKGSWGLGDVDAFAQQFGGYDAIKKGTPANNAMQSLMRRGQLVTPANVKTVLSKYKDGKY